MRTSTSLRHCSVLILVFAVAACTPPAPEPPPASNMESFEECVAAGYPVMESYPEQCRTPDGKTFVRDIGNALEMEDLIRMETPKPGDTVTSPLRMSGEARGTWYFEATFPVALEDANGQELATGFAQAQSEWMTEDFVPFEGKLMDWGSAKCAMLVIKNANPSGLPENEKTLRIPVKCASETAPARSVPFQLFFFSEDDLENASGTASIAVARFAPQAAHLPDSALRALLRGPTEEEETNDGALTSTDLARLGGYYRGVAVEDGIATVDFTADALTILNSAAARQLMVKAPIEATLIALPNVTRVQYSIDGEVFDDWDA